jgi:hypothetical protein
MDFEKLGAFYLGKEYDIDEDQILDRLVMYDARDLTTHAVCVGMTGSGKTGLCIDLLEEAAIDHVPALIIDPKGDITNLLLTFPELQTDDFRPWINVDDARRKGLTMDEFAAQQAELWKDGLARWGQDGSRIRLLKESAEYTIYTPGSDAGVPVSILQSFAAPRLDWDTHTEILRERIGGTVSALLGLIGVEADPVRSREHILISTLFEHFWRRGEGLDLRTLILSIQDPPFRELGVFDVDTFFPKKNRFDLAMNLNNIIAAPGFASWLQGQPLDISGFLTTPQGTPRHSIFYIAHLSDAERMFFVTMLLNQVVTWMRTQPGTTSLRALLYMDEIFGFFPPVANPPSKQPMLTLLKQARAFGLGVVLTTQNPVDLDYKGLTNAGTWFIGRLQTERDKMRVLDGLEGASSEAGQILDKNTLSTIISDLGKRVFLLHNVHEPAPITFHTRWAMSYLRGPLTRPQVRQLMKSRVPDDRVETPFTRTEMATHKPVTIQSGSSTGGHADSPPVLPDIQQVYVPVRRGVQAAFQADISQDGRIQSHSCVYVPVIMGMGSVHFTDRKRDVDDIEEFTLFLEPTELGILSWDDATSLDVSPEELLTAPEPDASFEDIPQTMNEPDELKRLEKDLADHVYRTSTITLLYSPRMKIHSRPSESQRDFQFRLTQDAREQRDEAVDKLTRKYEKKLNSVGSKLERAEISLEKKKAKASARKTEIAVSVGESVLGMFMGRRSTRAASTAMSKYRQSKTAQMNVKEAEEKVEALQEEIEALEEELKEETEKITEEWDESLQELKEISIRPRKRDIDVKMLSVAWLPHWQVKYVDAQGSSTTATLPAYQRLS